jgi:hypothetical protein
LGNEEKQNILDDIIDDTGVEDSFVSVGGSVDVLAGICGLQSVECVTNPPTLQQLHIKNKCQTGLLVF